jgi:ERCC4-type nuclease
MYRTHSLRIDHRESRSELAGRLAANPAWSTAFAQLDIGDYLIDDRILIERKSLVDLAASIKDGRLFRQTLRLASVVKRRSPASASTWVCALLIEGTTADLRDSKMTGACMRAALTTVSVFFGIPVLRSTNATESAQLLESIAHQSETIANGGLPRMGVRPRGKRGLQLHLLQGLPGIGPERAARLLDHFGSVRAVMAAAESELRAVPGVGSTCARKIVWSVEEEPADYTTRPPPTKTRIRTPVVSQRADRASACLRYRPACAARAGGTRARCRR